MGARASLSLVRGERNDPEALIPLRVAAEMLGLDPSTIRKRAAGTDELTLIPQGRKLFLVRREVVAYRSRLIDDARRRTDALQLISPRPFCRDDHGK